MKKFLRAWLGIKSIDDRLSLQHKTISNLHELQRKSQRKIEGNQSKIDTVVRKLSKH